MAKNQRTEVQVGDEVVTKKGTKGKLQKMTRHPLTRKPVAMFIDTGNAAHDTDRLIAASPDGTRRYFAKV